MVILITGASHTGKTLLAQRMLEKYKYPYLSIDHLKMGMILEGAVQFFRGCLPCDNYPKIVHRRYMKNGTSATPCTCALKPLIFEFRDSAEAFECLSLK